MVLSLGARNKHKVAEQQSFATLPRKRLPRPPLIRRIHKLLHTLPRQYPRNRLTPVTLVLRRIVLALRLQQPRRQCMMEEREFTIVPRPQPIPILLRKALVAGPATGLRSLRPCRHLGRRSARARNIRLVALANRNRRSGALRRRRIRQGKTRS